MTAATAQLDNRVLKVAGAVDADSVLALRAQGEAAISGANADLEVDLSGLETAHSVVLSMLMCWQRLAGSKHHRLTYTGMSDRLQELAALSNLNAL